MKENKDGGSNHSLALRILLIIGAIIIAIIITFMVLFFGGKTKRVTVKGNRLYDDLVVKNVVLNDKYSWNAIYVYLKYRFKKADSLPFIDSLEVELSSINTLVITVYEKDIVAYLYVEETGQYAYFDKDGIVQELSTEKMEDKVLVKGLSASDICLYERLNTDNNSLFKNLLSVTQALEKYHILPEVITVSGSRGFLLTYDKVTVNLGKADYLNEKMVRLVEILPEVTGLKGTLHLEDFDDPSDDIIFEKEG